MVTATNDARKQAEFHAFDRGELSVDGPDRYRAISQLRNLLQQKGLFGGGRGIRTPGTVSGSVVFKTTAIDHSAIPPRRHVVGHPRSSRAIRRQASPVSPAVPPERYSVFHIDVQAFR